MSVLFNAAEYLVDRHVAAGRGDRVAIRYDGQDTTYAELRAGTARVGAALEGLGVRRGERVMLFMADTLQLTEAILGAFRAGMIAVPVNTMLSADELGEILADSGARVLVATPEFAETAADATAGSRAVTHLVVLGGAEPDVPAHVTRVAWDDALAAVEGPGVAVADTIEDSPALWLYTSGTTGKPKAAMHRHANIRHVAETYGKEVLGIRPEDRTLSAAKLFFAYGIGNGLIFPLSVGATSILEPRRASPQHIAERAAADHPTLFFGVPTFFAGMLAAGLPPETMAGVRLATSAGEVLPAALQLRWTERYGVPILDGLGSTEALHIFLSNRPDDIVPGTSGLPVPGYEVSIRDGAGEPVQPGTPGTLYVRGESIATGYWCRTEASRSVFQGHWLVTGDTYVQDETGRYTCLGRSNDMIKAGGIWVSPSEVESRLMEHDDVAEAAVVGLPDEDGLDKPVACVVLRPGATVTERELIAFCREGMAHFKAPRSLRIVDTLPRTATGKLQRFRVRELLAQPAGGGAAQPTSAVPAS
ncbi:benzoate-CoA ligase family protein [Georgenia sp. AZ-5]|uniref:benzoate-CoA ligase family protein n=1 Tax=Georgenia sp. AZ-5 TaxID=3367526 RepID=UPI003754B6F1